MLWESMKTGFEGLLKDGFLKNWAKYITEVTQKLVTPLTIA